MEQLKVQLEDTINKTILEKIAKELHKRLDDNFTVDNRDGVFDSKTSLLKWFKRIVEDKVDKWSTPDEFKHEMTQNRLVCSYSPHKGSNFGFICCKAVHGDAPLLLTEARCIKHQTMKGKKLSMMGDLQKLYETIRANYKPAQVDKDVFSLSYIEKYNKERLADYIKKIGIRLTGDEKHAEMVKLIREYHSNN